VIFFFFEIAMHAAAPGGAQSKNPSGFFSNGVPADATTDFPRRVSYLLFLDPGNKRRKTRRGVLRVLNRY